MSFDFLVDGDVYTVIRDLHRTKGGGASVREARLERGTQNIESGANNVTRAVEQLLRLNFDDFTRTVMLPQGEFARFLAATPSERQQLLRGLMGLDIYGEIGSRARARESVAKAIAQEGLNRLEALDIPTEEVILDAVERLRAIDALVGAVSHAEKIIVEREASVAGLEKTVDVMVDAIDRMKALKSPDRLDEIGRLREEAATSVELWEKRHAELTQDQRLLLARVSELPSMESVTRMETINDRIAEVEEELSRIAIDRLEADLKLAEADVTAISSRLESARSALEASRISHTAHELASNLSVGDTCPVCSHVVDAPLRTADLDDLRRARSAVSISEEELDTGRKRVSGLSEKLGVERVRLAALDKKRTELIDDIPPEIDRESVAGIKSQLIDLRKQETHIQSQLGDVGAALKNSQRNLEDLAEQQRSLGNRLMASREAIADLKPARSESDDPVVQWKELLSWRDDKLAAVRVELSEVSAQLDAAARSVRDDREAVEESLAALDIDFDGSYSVAVARAQEQAKHRVAANATLIQESEALASQIEIAERRAAVARSLGQHLRADGFERWLMVGAIAGLVGGANELLAQLSGDGYSLAADDDGSFEVIDHRNANESRPISTLSGGETFLVSLALALSLAETLSAAGGAGLDAIILDEGFGTLDEELLEVVATVLEDLSERGLMVGIITHVKELAALAPVRFRVSKEPAGAQVEKVS